MRAFTRALAGVRKKMVMEMKGGGGLGAAASVYGAPKSLSNRNNNGYRFLVYTSYPNHEKKGFGFGNFLMNSQRRSIFIETKDTPNPKSLKFHPDRMVLEGNTLELSNEEDAAKSPLAKRIFAIEGVTNVFLGMDFVSVTITDEERWHDTKPEVYSVLMEFFQSGLPVIGEDVDMSKNDAGTEILDTDDEVVAMIKELLEARIRPAVQEDGGDIAYRGFEDGIVKLQLQGSCVGCPSSSVTLKMGIENMLKHYIPEVQSVEAYEPEGGGGYDASLY
eukprot:CAMPEP_0197532976 /NCGR_PEP_ID=MMETSP1318-20131121/41729_1 /TAXON_ID=552666 /ORGANISM="Partenskyella glossopodia, Strain RCC365" /LENGTH=275 /DNA_ID=CAMNT_0043089707 /DNA_START=44 /DNA_END=871 /DNA_ORIENTATION=+